MKRVIVGVSLAVQMLVVGAMGGCSTETDVGQDEVVDTDTDAVLATAAQELAPLMNDPALREALSSALAEKRTGDYEVLVRDLADTVLSDGRTLAQALGDSGIFEIEDAHFAAPGGARWSDSDEVLVTWIPAGRDVEALTYYRADGGSRSAPAEEEPSEAVIVIGRNERQGIAPLPLRDGEGGEELGQTSDALSANACNAWSCNAGSCRAVNLYWIKIFDDKEPWYKGDPEIYMTCTTFNGDLDEIHYDCGTVDLPGVNEEDTGYSVSKTLVSSLAAGYPVDCYVMESDGGDGDDTLGAATVRFEDGTRQYNVGDASFKLR